MAATTSDRNSGNYSLQTARNAKDDEFYTPYEDVEKELSHYTAHFAGKTVYCNCDDPFGSAFCRYFLRHFAPLRLKRLICTSYVPPLHDGAPLLPFDDTDVTDGGVQPRQPRVLDVSADDIGGRPLSDEEATEFLHRPGVVRVLTGTGDFRSAECTAYLAQCDIVVTNPPFSLFREFVPLVLEHGKRFLIIGGQNALTYKEIFPLIMDGLVWTGYRFGEMKFRVPADSAPRPTRYWVDATGQKWRSLGNAMWLTNLDVEKRHILLPLTKKYTPTEYPRYDSYDAINVRTINDIPYDYEGIMGVPVTILSRYNVDQLEIVGEANHGSDGEYDLFRPTLSGLTLFKRILIRNRNPGVPDTTKLPDLRDPLVASLLPSLLKDRTTGRNILWATDSRRYPAGSEMLPEQLTADVIESRVNKTERIRADRTKTFAEVFTPSWICNRMLNHADAVWFGRRNVFNEERDGSWTPNGDRIAFPDSRTWMDYVSSRRLEITCGESPFITSRYDASTGVIIPICNRIGILDRKLRVVGENTDSEEEWFTWTVKAFQSVYGYELQGDSLLIARLNLLMTFIEHLRDRWNRQPSPNELETIADIITRNVWQMDGLTGMAPEANQADGQPNLFALMDVRDRTCVVQDWRGAGRRYLFTDAGDGDSLFDLVVGNPPYQGRENSNGRANPVYHLFMEATFRVARMTVLITPARFLFNAGLTPKAWNRKMLSDDHFRVLDHYGDGSVLFPGTDIKGGVAVTCRDIDSTHGPVGSFTPYPELEGITAKVCSRTGFVGLDTEVSPRGMYRLTEAFFTDAPCAKDRLGKGTGNMLVSNILEKVPEMFTETPSSPDDLLVIGRIGNKRVKRYIRRAYVIPNPFIDTYNVMVPKSNGSGRFGETLTMPVILAPGEIATDTFMSIGRFMTRSEAEVMAKYCRTKFFRALLGAAKVTQDNPPSVWRMIPLPDMTEGNVDWDADIPTIDRQLYAGYSLTEEEILFIENSVKPME